MTVWFDTEDLFRYAADGGGRRTTGVQRLCLELYRALAASGADIGFVRHGSGQSPFRIVSWNEIEFQFQAQIDTAEDVPEEGGAEGGATGSENRPPAGSPARRRLRALAERVPEELRRPLLLATVMQAQAIFELARFGLQLVIPRILVRRLRRASVATPLQDAEAEPGVDAGERFRPGDVLLVLGIPWFRHDYAALVRWLRDERRMRFGLLMYDLVPVRRPEWSHAGTVRLFRAWYPQVLPLCDLVLAISRFTAADVEAFAREQRIVLPGPVVPVPLGTGFGPKTAGARPLRRYPDHPKPGSYVLFVSTLEARKNHALAFRIWARLLAEVRAGRRPAGSVPDLVFAGRSGWLVADLLRQMENTDCLDGWIRWIDSPTDGELRALYAGCLFTFYPSFLEGYGLPVTESLAAGKPCLCSEAASLPEAGGALCRYFDPEDFDGAYRAVVEVLDDRPGLAEWERRIRREFRPVDWAETAQAVLAASAGLDRPALSRAA